MMKTIHASVTTVISILATGMALSVKAGSTADGGIRFEGTDLKLGGLPPVSFHGFASQGVIASTDYNYLGRSARGVGSFQFNEMGLNASISPWNRTRITAQAFTFDVGNVGNHEALLDFASIEYTFSDKFGIRAGRVRRPGGIYNHIQDVDVARTSILLPQGMYDARWRDFSTSIDGGLVFGSAGLGGGGGLSYEAYTGIMRMSSEGGVARLLQNTLAPTGLQLDSLNESLLTGGQLWWATPVEGLRAGAACVYVRGFGWKSSSGPLMLTDMGDIYVQQYSLEYVWKMWTFQAEYYSYNFFDHQTANLNLPGFPNTSHTHPATWYFGASRRINKWLEIGSYYSEYYADKRQMSGNSDASQKDFALSARFDLRSWWVFKLEGHYINGTAQLNDDASNPVRRDGGWFMMAAKTTFSF